MMLGRSHLTVGTVTAFSVTELAGCRPPIVAAVTATAIATSKLPDVDLKLGIRHRGATHTILTLALIALVVGGVLTIDSRTAPYALAALVGVVCGYGMHLICDACTPHGVPAFAPFSRRDVHVLPRPLWIRTGSLRETITVCLFTFLTVAVTIHGL